MQTLEPRIKDFHGELIEPDDPAYDDARRVLNGMYDDRRPALIARPADAHDVRAALAHARKQGLDIAVRGGGHHVAGYGVRDDALVIDMRGMKAIDVDPAARVARVAGGVLWGELDAATQEYGLAVTGGRASTTGVVGQSLGSGSGRLERSLGLTCDNLLAAELVTADGRQVRASSQENADLFWALRGSAPNFGVVTSVELRLHPVGPIVLGGLAMFPADRAVEVITAWRELNETCPDEFGSDLVITTAPPDPGLPPEVQGRQFVGLAVCHNGDLDEGRALVEQLYAAVPPLLDAVQPMPYTATQQLIDPFSQPGERQYWKAENLAELSDEAIAELVEHGTSPVSPLGQLVLEPKGRAIARTPDGATALGGRDATYHWYAFSIWSDPADDEAGTGWARGLTERMRPYSIAGAAPNFFSPEGSERLRSTFGAEKYERLVALKREWDPENLFSWNQNIT
jgi:FAD/FMN-containing dehydrogenase